MNIFYRFTRKSLLKNRMRTIVTVIGIVLSMSLFTAVIEGAYSGVEYLRRCEFDRAGSYHGYFYSLNKDEAEQVKKLDEIKGFTVSRLAGWADFDTFNEYKPYLLIESIDKNFTDYVTVNLIKGRLPETSTEILLPQHLFDFGGEQRNIGDKLTVNVGSRVTTDGFPLDRFNPYVEDGEKIIDSHEITYTVVGIYKRLNWDVEGYECPGFTALTAGGGKDIYDIYFQVKHPSDYYTFSEKQTVSRNIQDHRDLLRLYGTLRDGNLTTVVYGFMGILIILISLGSISLIYNSFSISVSERTKQFGILKSVGATKKQIRRSVMYEAFLLGGIGIIIGMIVGCAGIGLTLYLLRDSFTGLDIMGTNTQIRLVLNPGMLLLAAVICMITTLISAWIPAKRAIKISPIEAIRQSGDMKIKSKEVKTSRLTQKLFGFEGMMASKNFKRNRRRYRSTVISLFLSVTLFISASSFCAYVTDSVTAVDSSRVKLDISYYTVGKDRPDSESLFSMLSNVDGIKESAYFVNNDMSELVADKQVLTDDYLEFQDAYNNGKVGVYPYFIFLDDNNFRKFCSQNGINAEDYFDKSAPKCIVYNKYVTKIYNGGESVKWYSYEVFKKSSLPCKVYYNLIEDFEGYTQTSEKTDENGKRYFVYYSQDYIEEFFKSHNGNYEAEFDESMAIIKPAEEVEKLIPITVGEIAEQSLFFMPSDNIYLVYPLSMAEVMAEQFKQDTEYYQTSFVFTVENHTQAYNDMKNILDENNMDSSRLNDNAKQSESTKQLVTIVNVFAYGFIILISLIAIANVFNTISTNVFLRRREFAMLKSIGLSEKGFRKMTNYECIIYGIKGLVWGLPASVIMTFIIYKVTSSAYDGGFYIPWYSVAIAVGSVFVVVFATMLYSIRKIKKDNTIDALKNENL